MAHNLLRAILSVVAIAVVFGLIILSHRTATINTKLLKMQDILQHQWERKKNAGEGKNLRSPWHQIPSFNIYMHMRDRKQALTEYKHYFLKGYRQNFPPEKWNNSLVISFSKEISSDRNLGLNLSSTWPYPSIYHHNSDKLEDLSSRYPEIEQFSDFFYPERYTKADYVGYVKPDMFFFTTVTPGSLFENKKPIIAGVMGDSDSFYKPSATRYLLGLHDVIQCTSYFPVMIKVQHVIKLRKIIEQRASGSLHAALRTLFLAGLYHSMRYSLLCNYVWYFHRDEYVFYSQLPPTEFNNPAIEANSKDTELVSYLKNIRVEKRVKWLPKPRIAISTSYFNKNGRSSVNMGVYARLSPKKLSVILQKSFCYVIGFEYQAECCDIYHRSDLFHELFKYVSFSREWQEKSLEQQNIYLKEANEVVKYRMEKGLSLFAVRTGA